MCCAEVWSGMHIQCSGICRSCRAYDASVFETTIRVLGGMLTAYELSNDQIFLTRCACVLSHDRVLHFTQKVYMRKCSAHCLSGDGTACMWQKNQDSRECWVESR